MRGDFLALLGTTQQLRRVGGAALVRSCVALFCSTLAGFPAMTTLVSCRDRVVGGSAVLPGQGWPVFNATQPPQPTDDLA